MFPEEPAGGEGTVLVPVNSTTTFRCSVAEGYTVLWQVQRPGANPITISESTPQFELAEISPRSSTFTLHDITEESNQTRVFCVATEEDDILNNEPSEVLLIIYGKCTAQEDWYYCHTMLCMGHPLLPTILAARSS